MDLLLWLRRELEERGWAALVIIRDGVIVVEDERGLRLAIEALRTEASRRDREAREGEEGA